MKKTIHPNSSNIIVTCACGNQFSVFSTLISSKLNIDVCNKCHPFYTGKQKIIDISGRVDGFYKRFNRLKNNTWQNMMLQV